MEVVIGRPAKFDLILVGLLDLKKVGSKLRIKIKFHPSPKFARGQPLPWKFDLISLLLQYGYSKWTPKIEALISCRAHLILMLILTWSPLWGPLMLAQNAVCWNLSGTTFYQTALALKHFSESISFLVLYLPTSHCPQKPKPCVPLENNPTVYWFMLSLVFGSGITLSRIKGKLAINRVTNHTQATTTEL
jgi:hypothetical protein